MRYRYLSSVMAALIVTAAGATASAESAEQLLKQARAAYKQRAQVSQAKAAVNLYEKAIKAGAPFDALWEGARATFFLGEFPLGNASRSSRLAVFDKGINWAKRAVQQQPNSAEANFWHGTMLGVWASARGIMKSLSVSGDVRRAAEKSIRLNGRVECGGPYRLLGRYYFKLPGLMGGDNDRSIKLLQKAVAVCPTNDLGHLYLAEVLHDEDRDAEARRELQKILSGSPDSRWTAERPYVARQAKALLEDL